MSSLVSGRPWPSPGGGGGGGGGGVRGKGDREAAQGSGRRRGGDGGVAGEVDGKPAERGGLVALGHPVHRTTMTIPLGGMRLRIRDSRSYASRRWRTPSGGGSGASALTPE